MGTYQGKGGAVWEITPPPEGDPKREYFDAQIASGDLVEVKSEVKKPALKVKADS